MTLYLTEAEVLERYIDGLKKSASRAGEFLTAEQKEKPKLFIDFINGIKTAAGSAHALAHAQMNPKWLDVRDILEGIITFGETLPQFGEELGPVWLTIQEQLNNIADTGHKMATSRAMTKAELDIQLDHRSKNFNSLN